MSYFLKLRLPKRAQSDANDANEVVDNQNKKKRKIQKKEKKSPHPLLPEVEFLDRVHCKFMACC